MRDTIYRDDAIRVIEALECFGYIECKTKALVNDINAIPSADRPTGDVDAVAIFEREMHNLEQGYITIGEFDERIEPLRHLCYGRPQGEWIYCEDYVGHDGYECSNCGFFIPWAYDCYADSNFILNYHTCPHCDARMKGADNDN